MAKTMMSTIEFGQENSFDFDLTSDIFDLSHRIKSSSLHSDGLKVKSEADLARERV